jgi:3-isopropylmalate/(R)-2-methylmalate dehydratase large subunit
MAVSSRSPRALAAGEIVLPEVETGPRPMTMGEKIVAGHRLGAEGESFVKPGDSVLVRVDGGYSHEFTSAQVHHFLSEEFGADYGIAEPARFAVFEDHLVYADGVPRMAPFGEHIETLRRLQREFQAHTGVRDFSARDGRSPGICHQVAREKLIRPGDLIQATDSHTCMGGGSNALAYGVGSTEYANLIHGGFTLVRVPESIRFELKGRLRDGVTAKDLMLHILLHWAREGETLDRILEFGGEGVAGLSPDERATLANMATECSAKSGIVEADDALLAWIAARQPELSIEGLRERTVRADPDATYDGGVHEIELSTLRPMVATPGDPDRGIPSDPTNGAFVDEIGDVPIDIAYGGSCTAGKIDDLDMYARVVRTRLDQGRRIADGVSFFIQFGSAEVEEHARKAGHVEVFERAGVTLIGPGCGACIGCGPGVSEDAEQVTVSAINRNFKGRSGPGRLYLASPLTVAASAFEGKIAAFEG